MLYSELQCSEAIHKAVERMGFAEMTEVQEKTIPVMLVYSWVKGSTNYTVKRKPNTTSSAFAIFIFCNTLVIIFNNIF